MYTKIISMVVILCMPAKVETKTNSPGKTKPRRGPKENKEAGDKFERKSGRKEALSRHRVSVRSRRQG